MPKHEYECICTAKIEATHPATRSTYDVLAQHISKEHHVPIPDDYEEKMKLVKEFFPSVDE